MCISKRQKSDINIIRQPKPVSDLKQYHSLEHVETEIYLRKMNGLVSTTFTLEQNLALNLTLFVSSHSGPALRVVPQGVERQLPAAARPQAFIRPQCTVTPSHFPMAAPHSAGHPQPPGLLSYLPSATVAHLLPSPCPPPAARPICSPPKPGAPPGHQRGHQPQAAALPYPSPAGPVQSSLSPALLYGVPVYAGFPLSPSKLSHYPYI